MPNTPEAQANRATLVAEQAAHIQAMARAINRTPDVTHRYLVTHSGIATRLTPAEAQIVRGAAGSEVGRARTRLRTGHLSRPELLSAPTRSGTALRVPGGVGTRGEGIIIAGLDGGVDPAHPSFANDAACGHGGATRTS